MVCYVQNRIPIGRCLINDGELIVLRPAIGYGQLQLARKAFLSVSRDIGQDQTVTVDLSAEHPLSEARGAAMQRIRTVIDGKMVFLSVQCKETLGDSVCKPSADGSDRRIVLFVFLQILNTENNIPEIAVFIRYLDTPDPGAVFQDLHTGSSAVFQSIAVYCSLFFGFTE